MRKLEMESKSARSQGQSLERVEHEGAAAAKKREGYQDGHSTKCSMCMTIFDRKQSANRLCTGKSHL